MYFSIHTNWSDGYKSMRFCIPMDLDSDSALPEPKGFISTTRIDAYENAVRHVRLKSASYTDGTRKITPFIEIGPDFSSRPILQYGWTWNCIWYLADDGDSINMYVQVPYYNQTGTVFCRVNVEAPIDIPRFSSRWDLMDWLRGNLFNYRYDSSYTRYGSYYIVSKKLQPLGGTISPLLADLCCHRMYAQSPFNPTASTEFFALVSQLKCNTNTIANTSEAVSLVKSLLNLKSLVKQGVKASERAADLWLKYRYCYNTTKSDMAELKRYLANCGSDNGTLRASFAVNTSQCHLKVRYGPTANTMLRKVLTWYSNPSRVGLDPSLYNLWDMIPFSFIADWFVPIGDNLERLSQMMWSSTMPYDTTCIASQKDTVTVNGLDYLVYERFSFTPSYDFTWVDPKEGTAKTWTKRGLDVIALSR